MPRLRYIEEQEKDDVARELIASAERTGAPHVIGTKVSELVPRANPTGNKVKFLWGLFTLEDS